jgi:two-component system cell cycle sensor histidine kinase PleC
VARELKSSFEMILKFSEHLKHETFGKLSDERYKECAEDIYFVGDHVLEMVDDIFDYARSDVSRLNLNFALVDARKILNNSIKLISNKSLELAIDIAKNYDNEPLLINVDAKRLKQSIIYILNNSLKFTPTGGTIKVEAHKILNDSNEELVEIVIEDSGTGISDYDLLKYLSPQKDIAFSQQDKYGGTGLGIPFTKNIVESMNGEFILTSQLGIGTKVVVRFYFCDS